METEKAIPPLVFKRLRRGKYYAANHNCTRLYEILRVENRVWWLTVYACRFLPDTFDTTQKQIYARSVDTLVRAKAEAQRYATQDTGGRG